MDFFKKLTKSRIRHTSSKQIISGIDSSLGRLHVNLQENIQTVKNKLGNSSDIIVRELTIGREVKFNVCMLFTDGLTDTLSVHNFIMDSLLSEAHHVQDATSNHQEIWLEKLKKQILAVSEIEEVTEFNTLFNCLLSGDVILLLDGYSQGFIIGMRGWVERGVTESNNETVMRGPREGFSENLRTNTALLRRKIKDPNLWLESRKIGRVTQTNVAVMYIKGIADEAIVNEVRQRLEDIDIDSILESGYIEELIEDKTFTPFPTIYSSERPDVIAAEMLEGKVAILVDGTPVVLIVPALFVSFLQAAEDYYQRWDISTLLRILRYTSFLIALLGPSLYIAVTTFHQEMLPTQLRVSLAAQREGVPFPAFIEALMMELTFEIVREGSLRMPKAIVSSLTIVGSLVMGTAAVEAGIVSAAMVIVVSITAIAGFVVPAFTLSTSIRMLRFPMMALAASFGLYGIIIGIIILVLHLCSLRSFGVPYMSPIAPFQLKDNKDTLIRVPLWALFSRPRIINKVNIVREQTDAPAPPKRNDTGG
ncbi:spore germination protein [Paenibacillus oryzisoli]|uniref:Spore gernimation protein KA n=1 Tax=Paenibacillus oryzisoli TaxID=1850517 RepID=A0A198A3R4_9BACL|nr:spore germination protein [Paenibacillus oryzisoli]OAS15795.1 spore gernimation protein KA [Paenibacillus oryzisoli]